MPPALDTAQARIVDPVVGTVARGFRAPPGMAVGGNAKLHAQIEKYAWRSGVDYDTALTRVVAGA